MIRAGAMMTPAAGLSTARALWTRPILAGALALTCTLLAVLPAAEIAPGIAPPLESRGGEHSTVSIPKALAPVASIHIGAGEQAFWAHSEGGSLLTSGAGIRGSFSAAGAVLRAHGGSIDMSVPAIGAARHLQELQAVAPSAHANLIRYDYGALSERYSNGPFGLEQGFTVAKPSTGSSSSSWSSGSPGRFAPSRRARRSSFRPRPA